MADLLQAMKDNDLAKTRALLAVEGVDVAYEFYREDDWWVRDRTSPIHQALSNWRSEYRCQVEQESPEVAANHHYEWRDIVWTLIHKGANVNAKHENYDCTGSGLVGSALEPILDMAIATSDQPLLSLALQSGGDPNSKRVSETHTMWMGGRTVSYPIHTAAAQLSYGCLQTLIEAKANVNAQFVAEFRNDGGYNCDTAETALHRAIDADDRNKQLNNSDKLRVVRLLLESGADVNAERRELVPEYVKVNSPVQDPRLPGYIPRVRSVRRRETPLVMALRLGLADEARVLVIHGADTSAKLLYGEDAPRSVWDLVGSDEALQSALQCKWEPQYHHLYPPPVRQSIFTTLCVAKRQAWPLAVELLHTIFDWAAKPTRPDLLDQESTDVVVPDDCLDMDLWSVSPFVKSITVTAQDRHNADMVDKMAKINKYTCKVFTL